jgi:ribosomal protein L7/L12
MSNTVLVLAMIAAGVVLVLLVVMALLRGRSRARVIEAPAAEPVPGEPAAASPDGSPTASMTMAAADSVVRAMVGRGEKIQAIKMVREMTGLGLEDAKNYVEALPNAPSMMTVARQMMMASSSSAGGASVRTEAIALLNRDQTIEAIKLVRERTGMGLKEAKDYVDSLAEGQRVAATDPRRPLHDPQLRQQVAQLLASGQQDQAMKLVLGMGGVSIEAARHFIDEVRRG